MKKENLSCWNRLWYLIEDWHRFVFMDMKLLHPVRKSALFPKWKRNCWSFCRFRSFCATGHIQRLIRWLIWHWCCDKITSSNEQCPLSRESVHWIILNVFVTVELWWREICSRKSDNSSCLFTERRTCDSRNYTDPYLFSEKIIPFN